MEKPSVILNTLYFYFQSFQMGVGTSLNKEDDKHCKHVASYSSLKWDIWGLTGNYRNAGEAEGWLQIQKKLQVRAFLGVTHMTAANSQITVK